jgi:hypothetical protein
MTAEKGRKAELKSKPSRENKNSQNKHIKKSRRKTKTTKKGKTVSIVFFAPMAMCLFVLSLN